MLAKIIVILSVALFAGNANGLPLAAEEVNSTTMPPPAEAFEVSSEAQEYMLELLLRILSGDVVVEPEGQHIPDDMVPTDDESQPLGGEEDSSEREASREKRDTVVFRPLFATREREAAKLNRHQRRRTDGHRQGQQRQGYRQPEQRYARPTYYRTKRDIAFPPLFVEGQGQEDTLGRDKRHSFSAPPLFRTRLRKEQAARRRYFMRSALREKRASFPSPPLFVTRMKDHHQDDEVHDEDLFLERRKRQATFTPLFVAKERHALKTARARKRQAIADRRPSRTRHQYRQY